MCLSLTFFFSVVPGLTWRDDVTQQVISSELSRLRTLPLHRQLPPSPPLGHSYSSSTRDGKLRPELSRNLQQYLSGLGFLSQLDDGRRLEFRGQDAGTQVSFSTGAEGGPGGKAAVSTRALGDHQCSPPAVSITVFR